MIKRLLIALLISSPALAATGPTYMGPTPPKRVASTADNDPKWSAIYQEMQNVYGTINAVPNGTFKSSSMTLQGLTVDSITINSQQSGISLGKIKQVVQVTDTQDTNTTSGTYVSTTLTGSITIASGSKVLVLVSGAIRGVAGSGTSSFAIFRGASNLCAANGCSVLQANVTGTSMRAPIAMLIDDTGASAGANTYTVKIANNNTQQVDWNDDGATSVLVMVEHT